MPKQDLEWEDDEEEEMVIEDDDDIKLPDVELEEDTFGMTVCAITRDSYFIAKDGISMNRVLRLITTLGLVVVTIILQVWILSKVKEFVCARAVHDIRISYDKFEVAMYGKEHCTLTPHGKHRGIEGFFPAPAAASAILDTMSSGDQDDVCRIPLSEPYFFGVVLLIWTLTCIYELRKALRIQMTIMNLEHCDSMEDSLGGEEKEGDEYVIQAMTMCHKALLTLVTFIPRVLVTLVLLWVGCRWLLATNNFGDLILNAVALEFILMIKEVIYNALMPFRNQHDLSVTKIVAWPKKLGPGSWEFVNTALLLIAAIVWVFIYMKYLQQVLPDYKWDVHEVCGTYRKVRYAV